MKEVLVTIPSDQKVLMDKIIEKYSIPTLMQVFGDLTRYEMKVNDYQINLLLEELKSLNIGSAYGEIVVRPISLLITSDKGKSTIPTTSGVNREEILANLSGVTSLIFYARADSPTDVEFGFGIEDPADDQNKEDSDHDSINVILGTEWIKYTIDTSDNNMGHINGVFYAKITSADGTIYLDNIHGRGQ